MLPTIASLVTIIIIIIAEILLEADGTTVTIKAYCKYDGNGGLIPVTAQAKEHIEKFEKLGYKQVKQQKLDGIYGIFCAFTLVNDEDEELEKRLNVEDEKDEELEQQLNTYHSAKKEMDTSKKYSEGWSNMELCSTTGIHGPNEIKDNEKASKIDYKEKESNFSLADIALNNYMQKVKQQKLDGIYGIFCAFTLVNDEDEQQLNVEDEKDEELEQQLNTYHSAKKEMDTSKKYCEGWSNMDPCSTTGIYGLNEIEDNVKENQIDYKKKSKKFLEAGIALDNYMQQKVQKKKAQNTNTEKVHGRKGSENSKTGKEKKDKM